MSLEEDRGYPKAVSLTDYASTDYASTDYASTDYASTDYAPTDYASNGLHFNGLLMAYPLGNLCHDPQRLTCICDSSVVNDSRKDTMRWVELVSNAARG